MNSDQAVFCKKQCDRCLFLTPPPHSPSNPVNLTYSGAFRPGPNIMHLPFCIAMAMSVKRRKKKGKKSPERVICVTSSDSVDLLHCCMRNYGIKKKWSVPAGPTSPATAWTFGTFRKNQSHKFQKIPICPKRACSESSPVFLFFL